MASATPKKKMEPIVFTLRGTAPDTKLEVFGQEYVNPSPLGDPDELMKPSSLISSTGFTFTLLS